MKPIVQVSMGWLFPAAMLFTMASPAHAEKVTFTFADHSAPTHYLNTQGSSFFMKRATELSNGNIQWRYFPAEQMGKAATMLKAVETDRVDGSNLINSYIADRLPLNNYASLPGLADNTTDSMKAYWSTVQEEGSPLRKEWFDNGVMPLCTYVLPPYQLLTRGGPVKSFADLKGRKIRTSGGAQNIAISELGAIPVQLPIADTYMALQRGTVDGAVLSFLSGRGWKIHEVINSASTNGNFASVPQAIIFNKTKFDVLPISIQAALKKAGDETCTNLAEFMDREEKNAAQSFKDNKVTLYTLPPEMLTEFKTKFQAAYDDWVERLEKRNLPARAVLKQIQDKIANQ